MKRLLCIICLCLCAGALADNVINTVQAGVAYIDPGATATDNIDGNITAKIVATGTVNVGALGTYMITYNVSDAAGNAAIPAVRTVIVKDTRPPVITLLGAGAITVVQGTSPIPGLGATATDSFAGPCAVSQTGAVDTSKPGTYTVTYNAKDPSGNGAIPMTQTVMVTAIPDTTPPVITIKQPPS